MTTPKPMDAQVLLFSDARGQYIPRDFAVMVLEAIKTNIKWGSHDSGFETELAELAKGPDDNEYYWEAWHNMLDSAFYTAENGDVYHLHQDGDLWAICYERLTRTEYHNIFGEWPEPPEDAVEVTLCEDCTQYAVNDELPPDTTPERDEAIKSGWADLCEEYKGGISPVDEGEPEFSMMSCECCQAREGGERQLFWGFRELINKESIND